MPKKTHKKKNAAKAKAKPMDKAKPKAKKQPKKAPPRSATQAPAEDVAKAASPKPKTGKRRSSKKTAAKVPKTSTAKADAKSAGKPAAKGSCGSGKCSKGTCSMRKQLDGRSLYDRARECKDLEECRKFIAEFNEAIEQANQWLDDMHAQALSAEQARDLYGEQISDLLEAVDLDRARIAELEADLKKARATAPESTATKATLDELAALGKEVRAIRSDLNRLLEGRGPSTERRQRSRAAERVSQPRRRGRPPKNAAPSETPARGGSGGGDDRIIVPTPVRAAARTARRGAGVAPGAFPKYSVLRGAACSLGVGKYGYPPEVCAPAAFSRSEAAEIMGTYAQNKYGGLAKWALITGLPIDDVAIPLNAQAAAAPKASAGSGARRKAQPAKARRGKASKANGESSNKQILDQVLLTVARV